MGVYHPIRPFEPIVAAPTLLDEFRVWNWVNLYYKYPCSLVVKTPREDTRECQLKLKVITLQSRKCKHRNTTCFLRYHVLMWKSVHETQEYIPALTHDLQVNSDLLS